jgi:NAD(P)H dehydrogenase (quinone)
MMQPMSLRIKKLAALLLLAGLPALAEPVHVLVVYHSQTGNTKQMADALTAGAAGVEGVEAEAKPVDAVTKADLERADAIALGSPVHMGDAAVEMRAALVRWSGEFGFWESRGLQNKVGAVFATGALPSNGKELTMMSLATGLLQFGVVLVSPYGSLGASATTYKPDPGVDEAEEKIARDLGQRLAEVAARMKRGATQ